MPIIIMVEPYQQFLQACANWLAASRVYGRIQKKRRNGKPGKNIWKWKAYAFNLANHKPLGNKLLAS